MNITKEEAIQKIRDGLPFNDSLFYAFRGDKEVVLEAVREKGRYLLFARKELRADKEVVLLAVMQNCNAIEYASQEIRELCRDKDPIEALEAAIRQEKFQAALQDKPAVKRKKTF